MSAESRPTVFVASGEAEAAAQAARLTRAPLALGDVPATPFALTRRRLVAYAVLRDARECEAGLVALSRGVSLVVVLPVSEPLRSSFLDDAARVAELVAPHDTGGPELTAEQSALLEGLANGRTLTAVAAGLGMSRRTATRRLAEVRRALGVETTVEALRAARK